MNFSEMISFLKEVVTQPEQAFLKQKGKGGIGDALKMVLAIGLLQAIVLSLGILLLGWLFIPNVDYLPTPYPGIMALTAIVFVGSIVLSLLGFFVFSGIYLAVAKLLGGKGTYSGQCYLLSLLMPLAAVVGIVSAFASIFSIFIPCCPSMVSFALSLYILYLYAIAIKTEHELDIIKAVAAILIPAIIIAILLFAVIFVFMFWNLGAFNPSQPTQQVGFSVLRPVAWNFQGAGYGAGNSLYATNALVAFSNIAGIDLTVAVNGQSSSKNSIIKFSKPGASNCGWYGDVSVVNEVGSTREVKWDSSRQHGLVEVPAGRQMIVTGLITGPAGPEDTTNTCGGPSGGVYRWMISYQTALDQYNIQHSDSGTITGKFQ